MADNLLVLHHFADGNERGASSLGLQGQTDKLQSDFPSLDFGLC